MAVMHVIKNDIKKDLDHFGGLHIKKKLLVFFVVAGLFIISILIGRSLAMRKSPANQAQKSEMPNADTAGQETDSQPELATTLQIVTSPTNLTLNTPQTVAVELSGTPVAAIDVILNYDPTLFEISEVVNGSVFDRVFVNKIEDGRLSYSAAVLPENANSLKSGEVFTFTVTPLQSTSSTQITFEEAGTITALNGENTLKESTAMTFTVSE